MLDEAWTGLDQAARGALDAAVDERLADGGAVMFVDHDQARLAGRVTERWQLGVAAATGPAQAQFAILTAALGDGVVLGAACAIFTLLTSEAVGPRPPSGPAGAVTATIHHPQVFLAGLLSAVVCLFVGAAVGALCDPPLLHHPGAAALAVVIVALAAGVSPANVAIRQAADGTASAAHWPGAVPLLGAAALLAVTWAGSIVAATRRERSLA